MALGMVVKHRRFSHIGARFLLLLLPICANPASVNELPPPAKRFALLVGVGKYKDPSITTLNGPTHDVEELKNTLTAFGGFDAKNIETLTSDSQIDSELPRRDNIIWKLNQFKPRLGGGLLLVPFSGHRIYKFKKSYLLTYETNSGNAFDLQAQA